MKQCTNCNSEISENEKFCHVCGKEQINEIQNITQNSSKNTSPGNQNVPGWLIALIIIFVIGFVYLGANGELHNSSSSEKKEEKPKYDTSRIYNIGELLICPNFEVTVNSVQIKVQGTYFNSYEYVADPEWIAVVVSVKNRTSETKRFYTSNFGLINSNGEVIPVTSRYYNVWNIEVFDSPELTSGGVKTGFIPFTNTNQDNSNLILTIDCGTGLFEDKVEYKVNISQ